MRKSIKERWGWVAMIALGAVVGCSAVTKASHSDDAADGERAVIDCSQPNPPLSCSACNNDNSCANCIDSGNQQGPDCQSYCAANPDSTLCVTADQCQNADGSCNNTKPGCYCTIMDGASSSGAGGSSSSSSGAGGSGSASATTSGGAGGDASGAGGDASGAGGDTSGTQDSSYQDTGFQDSGYQDSGFQDSGGFQDGFARPPKFHGPHRPSAWLKTLYRAE